VSVGTVDDKAALAGLPGVESVNDYGQLQEVRVTGDPQAFLRALTARTAVYHFEVARPSLHDIFVRIAGPGGNGGGGEPTMSSSHSRAAL